MTDDIRVTNVDSADNREWLITGTYLNETRKGRFQAHAYNRSVVAMCLGAKMQNQPVRVTWNDAKTPGFRTISLAMVL